MYQLSHLLSEQKSLLSALASTSILEDSSPRNIEVENKLNEKDPDEENKQKIAAILEKVEGCKVNWLFSINFGVTVFFYLLGAFRTTRTRIFVRRRFIRN